MGASSDVAAFFDGVPLGIEVDRRVREILDGFGAYAVRISTSQIAFRRSRAFAWLWRPGRYLRRPRADVVLSFAFGERDGSARFKEVVHPSSRQWMHHLEIRTIGEVDDEVASWLRRAFERAG